MAEPVPSSTFFNPEDGGSTFPENLVSVYKTTDATNYKSRIQAMIAVRS
jgi:hypothetical protein